jgi:hypothetical protein
MRQSLFVQKKERNVLKILVEWFVLLLRIPGFTGSILAPETGFSEVLRGSPRLLQENVETVP